MKLYNVKQELNSFKNEIIDILPKTNDIVKIHKSIKK